MSRPSVRVLRGNPDDAEVAALVAVVLGLAEHRPAACVVNPRRAWADPDRWVGGSARARPDAWRLAALPR
jgi:hypothetical protein